MSETREDYDELFEKNKKLQAELEVKNQELYDCKRQIKAAQTIEAEYQEEIKVLQSLGTLEQQKFEVKLRQVEESNSNLKATYNDRISHFEKSLTSKEDEVNELKKHIKHIKNAEAEKPVVSIGEDDELREHLSELQEQADQLKELLTTTEQQKLLLQEQVQHLHEELENYKETLHCKREELEEANALIQTLKDDYLCVKSELEIIKSKPLDDQSRGNSLFAEVDDRRLQLQKNMNLMKPQYIEMKRERSSLLKQITTLRNENSALIAQREAEIVERKIDEDQIIDSYKEQIRALNELIGSFTKELKERVNLESSSPKDITFFNNMMAMKDEEIENLRQQISSRSCNYISLSYDLAEAHKQGRKYNLEILQLKNEIGKLTMKIQEMEMVSPTEKTPSVEMKAPKSIVKSVDDKEIPKPTSMDDKEKDTANKKVKFVEDTKENDFGDQNKFRRKGKVLVEKFKTYS